MNETGETLDGDDPRPAGAEQALADLAFMRALVEESSRSRMTGGSAFLAGGLLYALQCIVQWAQLAGYIHLSEAAMVAFLVGVTVSFLALLGLILWREDRAGQRGVGMRALNAAFGGAGAANLVLCISFATVALRERSHMIWLLYPVTLCVVLGLAWYVAFVVRRRRWLLLVSVGWSATAICLALLTDRVAGYVLVLAAALLLLMALPGAVILQQGRKAD